MSPPENSADTVVVPAVGPTAAPPPAPRGPRLWTVLAAGAVGALLTLGLDAWFRSEPAPVAAGGATPASTVAPGPLPVADPAPARDLVVGLLGASVPASAMLHGVYPLRGAGRRPGETFPLLGFSCPPARACGELFDALDAPLAAAGFQMSRNIGGDRPGRPYFRAIARDQRPALALRAFPPGPRLTLVVDDLGREPAILERLLALDEHVTFAFLPNAPSAPSMAARLADAGREIIVDLPLEPQPPTVPDGPDFLTTSDSPEAAARGADRLLNRLPRAVGVINHLGGRFTTQATHMASLLHLLGGRGLFFLDDRTSPASVALETARVVGVRTAARTHALDLPGQDVRAAFKAVEAALVLDGQAVVVTHGTPETLALLGPWLDDLERRNIHLFRLSEIVL